MDQPPQDAVALERADRAAKLREEFAALERSLADPAVHADQGKARRLARRHAELTPVVRAFDELEGLRDDRGAAEELAAESPSFRSEVEAIDERLVEV